MKSNLHLTYQDHLDILTKDPQESAFDYSMYIKESQAFQSFSEVSSTVIFLLDYATKTYPLLGSGVKHVMGHPKEAFWKGVWNLCCITILISKF